MNYTVWNILLFIKSIELSNYSIIYARFHALPIIRNIKKDESTLLRRFRLFHYIDEISCSVPFTIILIASVVKNVETILTALVSDVLTTINGSTIPAFIISL